MWQDHYLFKAFHKNLKQVATIHLFWMHISHFAVAASGIHADGSSGTSDALYGSQADQWCAAYLWGA